MLISKYQKFIFKVGIIKCKTDKVNKDQKQVYTYINMTKLEIKLGSCVALIFAE